MKLRKNDKSLTTFVEELSEALGKGERFQVPGFGTFTTCTRKATPGRAACTIAMFRAATELRDFAARGTKPKISGPHSKLLTQVLSGMSSDEFVDAPGLGKFAIEGKGGKKPKLIFHGADEFNDRF
ncbi:MAG: HU family DNA-binding protein [Gammaproteobacteria bacterium]|nr:HU family DNA-binding protein [Gammaproteobacteria bacterium]